MEENIFLKNINGEVLAFSGFETLKTYMINQIKSNDFLYELEISNDDWINNGCNAYVDENGKIVLGKKQDSKSDAIERIHLLQKLLNNTDYIPIKIFEGVASKEEYKNELESRKEWRNEINMLEAQYSI